MRGDISRRGHTEKGDGIEMAGERGRQRIRRRHPYGLRGIWADPFTGIPQTKTRARRGTEPAFASVTLSRSGWMRGRTTPTPENDI